MNYSNKKLCFLFKRAIAKPINYFNNNSVECYVDDPYSVMNIFQLKYIAKCRGIRIPDTFINDDPIPIVNKLKTVDLIDPYWKLICHRQCIPSELSGQDDVIDNMTKDCIIYYMALNGLQVSNVDLLDYSTNILKTIARISLTCGKICEKKRSRQLPDIPSTLFDQSAYKRWNKSITSYKSLDEAEFFDYSPYPGDESNLTILEINQIINDGYYISPKCIGKYFTIDQIIEIYAHPIQCNDINYLMCMEKYILEQSLKLLGLSSRNILFLKYEEMVFPLSRRYIPYIHIDKPRLKILEDASDFQIEALSRLYDLPNDTKENNMIRLIRVDACSNEHCIFELSADNINKISRRLGMVIPSNSNYLDYFLSNISNYKNISTCCKRSPDIKTLSKLSRYNFTNKLLLLPDDEIFNIFGCRWYYDNRISLIHNAWSILHDNSNFFILDPHERNKCYNCFTAVMHNDINDPNILIIGYGNILGPCLGFELTDIEVSFETGEEGDFKFRIPDPNQTIAQSQYFDSIQVTNLKLLLLQYKHSDHLKQFEVINLIDIVVAKINSGLASFISSSQDSFKARKYFSSLDLTLQLAIKNVLIKLFEAGMYARRWKGPGHKFPLLEHETNHPVPASELNLTFTVSLSSFLQHISALPDDLQQFIYGLKVYRIVNGNIQLLNNYPLKDLIHKVGCTFAAKPSQDSDEPACFRLASVMLIGTAYYYLRFFCHYNIPNFNEQLIDNIA